MLLFNMLREWFPGLRRLRRNAPHPELEAALVAQRAGDFPKVRAICHDVLSRDPRNGRAHCLLGAACGQDGDLEAARKHLSLAVEIEPDFAEAHAGLGNVYKLRGDQQAAEKSYRQALHFDPNAATTAHNLATLLKAAERQHEALVFLRHAHEAAPGNSDVLWELVMLLIELDELDEAREVAEQACHDEPRNAVAYKALGVTFQHLHDPHSALVHFNRALTINPLNSQTHALKGIVLQELMQLDAAIAAHNQALALEPNNVVARWRRGVVHLLRGEFADGWRAYELRLLSDDRIRHEFPCPRWRNEPLSGRTILVHAEQGLGDEIMFASCIPDLVSAGARCIIDCHPKLHRLFARSFPSALIHSGHQRDDPSWLDSYPAPDYEVPAGSLPLHLRGSTADFPSHAGYLTADHEIVARWRKRLDALGPGLKVGLSWRGGTAITRAPLRSFALDKLLPVLRTPDVHFVNLQYFPVADELAALESEHGVSIAHWQEALDDYDETAALVCALDLIVSVCTSVVHLGGALGRPVWVMAPFSAEWRYGHAGKDMVWYPSVRLFRQSRYNDWKPVIEAVASALAQHARPEL